MSNQAFLVLDSKPAWRYFPEPLLIALADRLPTGEMATELVRICNESGIRDRLRGALNAANSENSAHHALQILATALTSYAVALGERRQFSPAARVFVLAIAIDNSHIPAWSGLALAAHHMGNHALARTWATNVLSLDPSSFDDLGMRNNLLDLQNQMSKLIG